MADTRNVTVTFDDGSSHNYQNVPKDVTPDQIEGRAQKEFSGKKIKNIAGDAGPAPEQKTTLADRAGAIGREALTGGIYGTFAPEMMEATGGGIELLSQGVPGPVGRFGQLAGAGLIAGGEAMRGSRLAGATGGLLSGLTGETAGQVAESKIGPGVTAETARLLGATLGPYPIEALGTKTGRVVGSLLGRVGVPGMGTAKTVGELLAEQNVRPENLTQAQKDFIAQKVNDIRGGKSSLDAQKEIADMLKAGAAKVELTGEQQAKQLEFIPHASTWLNGERFEDELVIEPKKEKIDKKWMFSNDGIEAKARELGVFGTGYDSYDSLKQKCMRKLNIAVA